VRPANGDGNGKRLISKRGAEIVLKVARRDSNLMNFRLVAVDEVGGAVKRTLPVPWLIPRGIRLAAGLRALLQCTQERACRVCARHCHQVAYSGLLTGPNQNDRSFAHIGQLDTTAHLALQNCNVLPERGILCLKLGLRLGWRRRLHDRRGQADRAMASLSRLSRALFVKPHDARAARVLVAKLLGYPWFGVPLLCQVR
jgi:hypothetical protein